MPEQTTRPQTITALHALQERFRNMPPLSPTQPGVDSCVMVSLCDTAQHAFSAYNDPRVLGLVQTVASNPLENARKHKLHKKKQKVQYVNFQHMRDKVAGVLKVHLLRAENVENMDNRLWFHDLSDPYVLFSIGPYYAKSVIKENESNPHWDSWHYLVIPKKQVAKNVDGQKLKVSLLDDDWETRSFVSFFTGDGIQDDLIGYMDIDMTKIMTTGEQSHACEFKHKHGDGFTSLVFTTEFIDFENAYREAATRTLISKVEMATDVLEESHDWMFQVKDGEKKLTSFPHPHWIETMGRVPLDPVAFISSPETDTEVWVCVNRGTKSMTISFRGTELGKASAQDEEASATQLLNALGDDKVNDYTDVFTDIRVSLKRADDIAKDKYILRPSSFLKQERFRIHSGFLLAYASVREALMQVVYDITGWSNMWHICATGHSLGGALATLCAFEFANRSNDLDERPIIGMVNFGAPRVGDQRFVDGYNRTVVESYRCAERDDPVPTLPPKWLGYRHVSKLILWRRGSVIVEKEEPINKKYTFLTKRTGEALESGFRGSQSLARLLGEFMLWNPCQCAKIPPEEKQISAPLPVAVDDPSYSIVRDLARGDKRGLKRLKEKHLSANYCNLVSMTARRTLPSKLVHQELPEA